MTEGLAYACHKLPCNGNLSSTRVPSLLFALFWINWELGGVRHCQDGDGSEAHSLTLRHPVCHYSRLLRTKNIFRLKTNTNIVSKQVNSVLSRIGIFNENYTLKNRTKLGFHPHVSRLREPISDLTETQVLTSTLLAFISSSQTWQSNCVLVKPFCYCAYSS